MKFTALTLSALVALMSVSATPAPLGERSIEERQWNVTPCGGDQVVSVKVGGYIEYRDGARDYCNGMLGQRCDKVCHDGGNIHD